MAGRQRHLFDVGRVPGRDDEAANVVSDIRRNPDSRAI